SFFHVLELRATRELNLGEGAVFGEVEAPFTEEVREARLPRGSAHTHRDAFAVRQRRKATLEVQRGRQVFVEVGTVVGPPELGADEHVGVKFFDDFEDSSGTT